MPWKALTETLHVLWDALFMPTKRLNLQIFAILGWQYTLVLSTKPIAKSLKNEINSVKF